MQSFNLVPTKTCRRERKLCRGEIQKTKSIHDLLRSFFSLWFSFLLDAMWVSQTKQQKKLNQRKARFESASNVHLPPRAESDQGQALPKAEN
jgi:hypothetical protein